MAPLEWERLHVARAIPVETPEPIALNAEGSWFGVPALLVSYIDGSTMNPPQPPVLGRLLATIHSTPAPSPVVELLLHPGRWMTWRPDNSVPLGFEAVIERLRDDAPTAERVLSHCDFHPANVLVDGDGHVNGVVDWANLRLAPRAFDVAQTRCDLAIDPGGDAPDEFLRAYEDAVGGRLTDLAPWEVLAACRAYDQADAWVDSWTDAGTVMTAAHIRNCAESFGSAATRRA